MKLRMVGTANSMNVEHQTFNIERRILMTLRFIDFKTSKPQPATSRSTLSSTALWLLLKDSRPKGPPRRARGLSLSKAAESNFEG
jgi:hypothetical protein